MFGWKSSATCYAERRERAERRRLNRGRKHRQQISARERRRREFQSSGENPIETIAFLAAERNFNARSASVPAKSLRLAPQLPRNGVRFS